MKKVCVCVHENEAIIVIYSTGEGVCLPVCEYKIFVACLRV